mmetsp:Transcript_16696/g.20396  ORF Transcript_16696/g.20396 Transcript_16696/m.20396 type:complete len:619 (-) Transcript_16696:139-1995(-)
MNETNYEEVAFMHTAPRFGHTDNIAQLASLESSRRWDYINGIIAFCIFFLSIFIFWLLLQILFKCLGNKRVGFLSGQMIHDDRYINKYHRTFKVYNKVQYAFFLCCIIIIIGVALLLTKGLPTIDIAIEQTIVLLEDVQITLEKGLSIANSVDVATNALTNFTFHQDLTSDNYCVNSGTSIASLLVGDNGANFEESILAFENIAKELENEEANGMTSGIEDMLQAFYSFGEVLLGYNDYHWIALLFIMVLCNLCLFIMGSSVVTKFRKKEFQPLTCMTAYFVLPFFIAMVLTSLVVTVMFASGAIVNSDLCIGDGEGGPESTIQNALLENGYAVDDITYQSFEYYRSDCTMPAPWIESSEVYGSQMQDGIAVADLLLDQIEELGELNLSFVCGTDITPIVKQIYDFKRDLSMLLQSMDEALELGSCERVSPLYRRFFDGPLCKENLAGLSWTFYALFTICLGGFFLLTLRAGLYKIKLTYDVSLDDSLSSFSSAGFDEFNKKNVARALIVDPAPSDDTDVTFGSDSQVDNQKRDVEGGKVMNTGVNTSKGELESCSPSSKDIANQSMGLNSFNEELQPISPSCVLNSISRSPSSSLESSSPNFFGKSYISPSQTLTKL